MKKQKSIFRLMVELNGILPLNKPENISSAQVVARVKHCLSATKVGHTGTLDPFAKGLLLVAIGKATRISKFFLEGIKEYVATVTLGIETDTYDKTGTVIFQSDVDKLNRLHETQIRNVLSSFIGRQKQIAPSFSALKYHGQALYKLARQGKIIIKPARVIDIFKIEVIRIEVPKLEFRVLCSSGTYIRSLAHDIGTALGCGASLSDLLRTKSSHFCLNQAVEMNQIYEGCLPNITDRIINMSESLSFMPCIEADDNLYYKISHGLKLSVHDIGNKFIKSYLGTKGEDSHIRVVDSSKQLIALIYPDKTGSSYIYSCVFA